MGRPRTTAEQFWAMGTPEPMTGCLLWTGRLQPEGDYPGQISFNNERRLVAHVALELDGRPLLPGQEVLHSCDQPSCFEPRHLRGGTHKENIAQRDARGRTARGERHWMKKKPERIARGERHGKVTVSDQLVEIVRAVHSDGVVNMNQLARWFGVGQSTVSRWIKHEVRSAPC